MATRLCLVNLSRGYKSISPVLEIGGNLIGVSSRSLRHSTNLSPTVLAGASLHSLPGHRQSLKPSSSHHATIFPHDFFFTRNYRTQYQDRRTSHGLGALGISELEGDDFTPLSDSKVQADVTNNINSTLSAGNHGRLFAVVYIRGMQYKVTAEDILTVKHEFPPKAGEKLRLEKVLAVGGKDFTLFGQPLLSREVVKVEATVVEKTLSPTRVWFMYIKRRGYFNIFRLFKEQQTMLVINSIQMAQLPETQEEEEPQAISQ